MGTFGEDCAGKYAFTREQQDAFATASVQRAQAATQSGAFAAEITPVTVKTRAGETIISIDEGPGKVKLDKIASLKPAFKKDGTITAASSSSINDGAAAMVMMRATTATKLGARPLARVIQREVRDRLTDEILFGQLEHGGTVTIGLAGEALTFTCEARTKDV